MKPATAEVNENIGALEAENCVALSHEKRAVNPTFEEAIWRQPKSAKNPVTHGVFVAKSEVDRAGIEPATHGFSVRCLSDATTKQATGCGDGENVVAPPVALNFPKSAAEALATDPDIDTEPAAAEQTTGD